MNNATVKTLHEGYYKLFQESEKGHIFISRKDKSYLEGDRFPDCVVVKAHDKDGRLLVIREYRPILGAWIWALPAGKVDKGESMFDAAIREVKEECGLTLTTNWHNPWYSHTFSSPGITDEMVGIVTGQVTGEISNKNLDGDEQIEAYLMDPDDLIRANLHKPSTPMSIWLAMALL